MADVPEKCPFCGKGLGKNAEYFIEPFYECGTVAVSERQSTQCELSILRPKAEALDRLEEMVADHQIALVRDRYSKKLYHCIEGSPGNNYKVSTQSTVASAINAAWKQWKGESGE